MEKLAAPIIDHHIRVLDDGRSCFNSTSWELINTLFDLLDEINPCGDDNRHELWITAPKGKITDFGDYKYYLEEGIVSNKEEFEKLWNEYYPEETYWYELTTISFKQTETKYFKAIFLNGRLLVQSPSLQTTGFEMDISDFINFLIASVKECINKMENNTYNDFVKENLPYDCRYGTIPRGDFWKVFPDRKKDYLKDISDLEIKELEKYINLQEKYQKEEKERFKISKHIGRLDKMTANMFYYYCSLGYKENNYKNCNTLSPKELYYENADGRDEGLKDIDGDSSTEFENWYNDKTRGGGHPWEVCRGGNSTHVSLFVRHDNDGYYLDVDGKSYGRSIETLKFYFALKRKNIPVFLSDAKELLKRILETDKIGIVPHFVLPFYCESSFPDEKILDFIHINLDEDKSLLKYITWQNIEEQFLNN